MARRVDARNMGLLVLTRERRRLSVGKRGCCSMGMEGRGERKEGFWGKINKGVELKVKVGLGAFWRRRREKREVVVEALMALSSEGCVVLRLCVKRRHIVMRMDFVVKLVF